MSDIGNFKDSLRAMVEAQERANQPAPIESKPIYQVWSCDGGEWYEVGKAQYDRANADYRRILPGSSQPALTAAPEQVAPTEAFAWAVFAENGNVIIWSKNRAQVEPAAKQYGRPVVPVIALSVKAQPSEAALLAEALALLRTARDDCGLGSELGGKVDALLARAAHQPAQEQAEPQKGAVTDYGTPDQAAQHEAGDERAAFEKEFSEVKGAAGVQHDVIGWYYFDDEVEAMWKAWQARAALAASPVVRAQSEESATAAVLPVDVASPTGEQLYVMVTKRFKSGSFPWSMVAENGKAAWEAAAAELAFAPDTIMSRHAGRTATVDAGAQQAHAGADEVRRVGSQMANVLFNLAQRPGDALDSNAVSIMDKLRKEWDAAIRAAQEGEK